MGRPKLKDGLDAHIEKLNAALSGMSNPDVRPTMKDISEFQEALQKICSKLLHTSSIVDMDAAQGYLRRFNAPVKNALKQVEEASKSAPGALQASMKETAETIRDLSKRIDDAAQAKDIGDNMQNYSDAYDRQGEKITPAGKGAKIS